ncbi:hypothetical protein ACLOJK_040363 [Asimina triloba]
MAIQNSGSNHDPRPYIRSLVALSNEVNAHPHAIIYLTAGTAKGSQKLCNPHPQPSCIPAAASVFFSIFVENFDPIFSDDGRICFLLHLRAVVETPLSFAAKQQRQKKKTYLVIFLLFSTYLMATITRSVIRSSTSIRNVAAAAAKLSSEAGASRSSSTTFRFASSAKTPSLPSRFLLRSPVEMSCCIETLLPLHTVTSSAVLTSLLSVARPGYGWLSEGTRLRDL